MNVLIDTNVMLDYLTNREPHYKNANTIMSMCASEKIYGCIAAHSVMNSFYILRNEYSARERRDMLLRYIKIVDIVDIDASKIIDALNREDFADVEDCLQEECAYSRGVEYIVTRNVEDYKNSRVRAVTPEAFISFM